MALTYEVINYMHNSNGAPVIESRHRTREAAEAKIARGNRSLKSIPGMRTAYNPWRIRVARPSVPAKYRAAACYDYWEMNHETREYVHGGMSGSFELLYDLYVISNHRGQQPDDFTWRITARMKTTDEPNADMVVAEVYGG